MPRDGEWHVETLMAVGLLAGRLQTLTDEGWTVVTILTETRYGFVICAQWQTAEDI